MIMSVETSDRLWRILRPLGWIGVFAALLAPAIAMRFTDEVQWTPFDFMFAGAVLIGAASIVELFAWRVRHPVARIAFGLFMVGVVGLIWGWAVAGP